MSADPINDAKKPGNQPNDEPHTGQDDGSQGKKRKPIVVTTLSGLLQHKFPEREPVLAPVFNLGSLNMIFARRGIGKTYAALYIAYAAASGGEVWGWKASRPFKTLYIDGEMPGAAIQERLAAIVTASDEEPSEDFFKLITIDMNDGRMPDLSALGGQSDIEPYCLDAEVIVIDNLSCLCRSGRENDSESWYSIGEWALRMRSLGKCVLFVHHAGKDGNQRGNSKKEDVLDLVIELKRPADYDSNEGARFIVAFSKHRHLVGDDAQSIEAKLETIDGKRVWSTQTMAESTYEQCIELACLDLSVADIAAELAVHKSSVTRHLKRAVEEGRITSYAKGKPGKKNQRQRADVDG